METVAKIDVGDVQPFVPGIAASESDLTALPRAEHIFIGIHGAGVNPTHVFRGCLKFLKSSGKDTLGRTGLVCPQFYFFKGGERYGKSTPLIPGLVVWQNQMWKWGGSLSAVTTSDGQIEWAKTSACDVLDQMIAGYCDQARYPDLRAITVIGFSAGGQLVHRYSLATGIDTVIPGRVRLSYIVAAPSSYMYLDRKRMVGGNDGNDAEFDVPELDDSYHRMGYGLTTKNFSYFARQSRTTAEACGAYARKRILYLVGEDDVGEKYLDLSPPALLQGENRRQRAEIFFRYLRFCYRDAPESLAEIDARQRLLIVADAGHSLGQVLSGAQDQIEGFLKE